MTKKTKRVAYIAIIGVCILFACILARGSDIQFHLYRIGGMAAELKNSPTQIPIRMLSESYNGYGYGVSLFYGDLLLYIPAVLVALGMPVAIAYQILMIFLFVGAFALMYWQMYRVTRRDTLSFLCAVFYVFSSYFLTDLCMRSSAGEAAAFLFLPFVFCSFYNMVYHPAKYDWLCLAMGMSGLILSHNLITIFTAVILIIWAVIKIKDLCARKSIPKIILATVATMGATASFWIPMLEAMSVQRYQTPSNSGYQMQEMVKHTLDFVDFWLPYEIKKGLGGLFSLNWDAETWHPGAAGLFLALIFVLEYKTRKMRKNRTIQLLFWICVVIYAYMFIEPLVAWSGHIISFVQFEWRFLTFCTFGFSVYAAYLLEQLADRRWTGVYICLAILVGLFTIGGRYVYQVYLNVAGLDYIQDTDEELYEKYILEYDPNAADNMYLPEGVQLSLYQDRGETVTCNYEDVEVDFYRDKNTLLLSVENNTHEDTVLELPLYYYKGYTAVDTQRGKTYTVTGSEQKLVQVLLESEQNADIKVWYQGTLLQRISDWISVITILCTAAGVCLKWRKASKKDRIDR